MPILEDFDEAGQPSIGLVAVDDAMVDGQRHIRHRQYDDRIVAIDLANDDAFLQLADAEDRGLALVDNDRRREQAARHAVVGNGEASARDLGAGQLAVARAAQTADAAQIIFCRWNLSRSRAEPGEDGTVLVPS